VTVSIGVAARQASDLLGGEIVKRADLALYQAKENGRNRVVAGCGIAVAPSSRGLPGGVTPFGSALNLDVR
jgi:predicted signal transduction protein with EAL and GGDEF domain